MNSTFDWIIVGGGAAGCIVALNLLERGEGSILLVEAGDYPVGRRVHTPALYIDSLGSRWDWSFRTTSQAQLSNRRLAWPRGKTLGGSAALNAMIYTRGHPFDFREWEKDGLEEWSYADCLKAYQRIEQRFALKTQNAPVPYFASSHWFLDATKELGWQRHQHLLECSLGAGSYLTTVRDGRRFTSWDLLRKQLGSNSLLTVSTQSMAQKVVVDRQVAVGLQMQTKDGFESVGARRGIVLTAGSIQTPQLLLKSGIGDRQDFRKLGIDCVHDLPGVGKNLQDHLLFPMVFQTSPKDSSLRIPTRDDRRIYALKRIGPLCSNLAEVGGFGSLTSPSIANDRSKSSEVALESPSLNDVEKRHPLPDYQLHVTPNHYLEYASRKNPTPAMTIGVTWLRPQSRGEITFEREGLRIDPKYLTSSNDLECFVEASMAAHTLSTTETFQRHGLKEIFPGTTRWDRESLLAWVRKATTSLFHPVGSCRMGSDSSSVVNSHLGVHGIQRLAIADASVIPYIPRGNTQATAMMVADRFTEFLED